MVKYIEADTSWMEEADCKGLTELFYAPPEERVHERDTREALAKRVCGFCAVQEACLLYALDTNEKHGIWGGFNEEELRRLRRRRSTKDIA